MSLRFVDGFDHYASGDLLLKWNAAFVAQFGFTWAIDTNQGRLGNGAWRMTTTNGNNVGTIQKIVDAQSTWVIGCAYKFTGNITGTLGILGTMDSSTIQGDIRFNSSGFIYLTRNGTTLATATSSPLVPNQWYFIEFKHIVHSSTGTMEVRVNGQVVVTFSGNTQATGNASANTIYLGSTVVPNTSINCYYDDLYACDGQGTMNNYLGDCRVNTLLANAAGTDSQFTQTGGTISQPWTAVNNSTPDSDTSYLADSAVGDSQTLAFQDLTGTPGVKAVVLTADLRKDDAGPRTVSAIARPGVTDQLGTAWSPGTSYVMTQTIWENNPDTSNPWQASEVNAAEFGIKNVS